MEKVPLSVSDFISLTNQTLEYAYPTVLVVGEIQSFKINQNKYVFFDLRDEVASISCFMMSFQLRIAIENGMKVAIEASPKLTTWGKFSLTVKTIKPVGEGNLKRSFDLLVQTLAKDGLLREDRKRTLPSMPQYIGVVSSVESAGYADFLKIIHERWGGMKIDVRHVAVQGMGAPDAIIRALTAFNQQSQPPELIAIMRGGGSADDLSVFNDEPLVRAMAASRTPIITGIGHETDTTLADMVADYRAATPSNAAQIITPDRIAVMADIHTQLETVETNLQHRIEIIQNSLDHHTRTILHHLIHAHEVLLAHIHSLQQIVGQLDPQRVLKRGYAILKDAKGGFVRQVAIGQTITIETNSAIIKAGVKDVKARK